MGQNLGKSEEKASEPFTICIRAGRQYALCLYAAFGRGDFARPLPAHRKNVDRRMTGRRAEDPTGRVAEVRNAVFAEVAKYEETIEFSPREFHASARSAAKCGVICAAWIDS